ncbi:hypothetical protein ES705_44735 [subsurface metagenome]
MVHDFTNFDEFKKALGNKWKKVSGYDITTINELTFEGLQAFIYSVVLKKLDAEDLIHALCRRAIIFYRDLKLNISEPIPNKICKGNLDKYLESGF